MMPPGDSDLEQRVVSVFINYFLNQETSSSAVQTALTSLTCIEQEYNKRDNSTWGSMLTSTVSATYTLLKPHHLEKIKVCKHALEHAQKHDPENLGLSAVEILLEFFRKSDSWWVGGYIRGPSLNMRLTCELIKAAGLNEDCGLFLQQYPKEFLFEVEAAAAKVMMQNSISTTDPTRLLVTSPMSDPASLIFNGVTTTRGKVHLVINGEESINKAQRLLSSPGSLLD